MRSIIFFTILVFSNLVLSIPAFSNDNETLSNISGVFEGNLLSNQKLLPVETRFNLTDQGNLTGTYVMTEEGGTETGKFKNIKLDSDYSLTMTWVDKYGEGTLRVLFSEDYSTFKGFWGDSVNSIGLDWDGDRQ